jgi:hypothetical protein
MPEPMRLLAASDGANVSLLSQFKISALDKAALFEQDDFFRGAAVFLALIAMVPSFAVDGALDGLRSVSRVKFPCFYFVKIRKRPLLTWRVVSPPPCFLHCSSIASSPGGKLQPGYNEINIGATCKFENGGA